MSDLLPLMCGVWEAFAGDFEKNSKQRKPNRYFFADLASNRLNCGGKPASAESNNFQ